MPTSKFSIDNSTQFQPKKVKKQIPVLVVAVTSDDVLGLPKKLENLLSPHLKKSHRKEIIQKISFHGSYAETFYLPIVSGASFQILLIGLGRKKDLEGYRMEQALTRGIAVIKAQSSQIHMCMIEGTLLSTRSKLIGMVSSVYQYKYRSLESLQNWPDVRRLVIISKNKIKEFSSISKVASAMGLARSATRDLVNTPPNKKNTQTLASFASKLRSQKIGVKIQRDQKWIQKNMPCFYTVARGSLKTDPPQWITLHYKSKSKIKHRISLVGKSVLFDTGGYQIKPGNFMRTMKADMTGGATVLSIMQALSQLQPKGIEVYAHLAATPNMIDANAFVPDDIVDTTCGKKVEIQHTDAEGRMTLIDAVTMAQKKKPEMILVIATLTGSATRAVGMRAALLSNHAKWRTRFAKASRSACDPYQELDVVAEDYEAIRSKLDGADIKNTGNPKGRGAQSAAAFVFTGAPKTPIVQLDIAGGDMTLDDKSTGITVQSGIEFLLALSKS